MARQTNSSEIQSMIEHQQRLGAARQEVDKLRSLIETQQAALIEAEDGSDSAIEALHRRREDILADIATGNGDAKALEAVDQELQALLDDANGSSTQQLQEYRTASQALAGLRRKLESAEAELAELEGRTPENYERLIRAEAEAAGKAFLKAGEEAIKQYGRLLAFDRMLQSHGVAGGAELRQADAYMEIPAFRLECFEGVEAFDRKRGIFFTSTAQMHGNSNPLQKYVEAEVERLKSLGIEAAL